MSIQNQSVMGLDRKEIDDKILNELHEGRNVPSNLADEFGVSRQYIQQRLKLLEAANYVENIGRGVYEIINDPRDERAVDDTRADVSRICHSVRAALTALEDESPNIETCRSELEDALEECDARTSR
ncbi:winged helix-turn-helix domain-containing protein [Natronococcus sp. A-GB1]|uniref:winged helix-turn-helix domain-containing protein n=1 Tax=Natronococcus sp. A-GB1 TaxID=3037648 RepID=UPI00241EC78C|nr:winged helix-turn-helix domain-containing protein [Natronococcus sp. A-GB1]MDG5761831.1 winged helix-turn-helix domain-containing protein [Natronococcus sp. A-GB1]